MTLEASQISVAVGKQPLLQQVSITLKPGVLTMVIGPNGSGKTTLLNALAGDNNPVSGQITLNDKPLSHWRPQALARVRSVLPQLDTLSFPFRAREVVLMGRSPWSEPRSLSVAIANDALREMDARHLAERIYPTLSGGEKQRVQLARVLAQIWPEPQREQLRAGRYLLLDEPVSALDLGHQYTLLDHIKRQTRAGAGALVTLHDLNLAAQFADELVLLDKGRIAAAGAPETVLNAPLIEAVYDIPVKVMPHPVYSDTPLVVPVFRAADDAAAAF